MNIIGLSAYYHESACCLIQAGKLIAAAAEERFTRIKHDPRLPMNAFRFCLEKGGIDILDLDCIAYYELPEIKSDRQLSSGTLTGDPAALGSMAREKVERDIREMLGFEGTILFFSHHLSHAASSFFYSGFQEAAILTLDGVGEWTTTSYGYGQDESIRLFEEVRFPHSLGLLYATITAYLGFQVNNGEYKVMGLAAYGQPSYLDAFRKLIRSGKEGRYELDLRYFDFVDGNRMYSEKLCALFGQPARKPETALTPFHKDVAKSLQNVLEEILLEKVEYLASRVNSRNLCLAGGIALNSVANGRIARESPFEHIFIQPAAGDAGACLGAAALAHIQLSGKRHTNDPLKHIHLGPSFSEARIAHLVAATGLPFVDYRNRERTLLEDVSDRLLEGKVIGWFQGAMEFGPRALGGRSIIANPMTTGIAEKINSLIKKRERFRPFAPTVLESEASKHFDLDHASPFMLETCRLISPLDLPGIRHVDGSSRPQTVDSNSLPIYRALLECFFQKSGCPILLNTSFNVRGEPIVCAPVDALLCMGKAPLDALVLGHFLIDRENLPENWSILVESWQQPVSAAFETTTNALKENLYSFV